MSDFNFNENTINKLKDMMNKGELNDVISKIPPEMIQNFSSIMQNNNSSSDNLKDSSNSYHEQNSTQDTNTNSNKNLNSSSNLNPNASSSSNSNTNTSSNTNNSNNASNNNFDFNNIDMNTILKMKSVIEKMNSKNDPRSNLLYSLKPYLREERKEKLDQYANLLNVAKIADLLKNDNKENNNG